MPVPDKDLTIHLQVEAHDLAMSTPPESDFRWFAFCVTAAFKKIDQYPWSVDQVKKYLFPWSWSVDKIEVAVILKDGSTKEYHGVSLVGRPKDSDKHPIIDSMMIVESRAWNSGPRNFSAESTTVTFDDHPWAGSLRAAADYPDDLPQVLGVARYFKLSNDKIPGGAQAVYVAPYVNANTPDKFDKATQTWTYKSPMDAPAMEADLRAADLKSSIAGWIAPKDVEAGTAWWQHLPDVFADAMQPVRAFLGQFAARPLKDEALDKQIDAWVYSEVFSLFRDSQEIPRPDKQTFVDTVVDGAVKDSGAQMAIKKQIHGALTSWTDAAIKDAFNKAVWGEKPPQRLVGDLAALFELTDEALAKLIWDAWALPKSAQNDLVWASLTATRGIGKFLRAAATAKEWKGLKQDNLKSAEDLTTYIVDKILLAPTPIKLVKATTSDMVAKILDGAFRHTTKVSFEGLKLRFADPTTDPDHQKDQWNKSHRVLPLMRHNGATDWTIPTSSKYKLLTKAGVPATGDKPAQPPIYSADAFPPSPAAIPVQLFAVNGMLQAMNEYRNQPLASPSPLQEMSSQRGIKTEQGGTSVDLDGSILFAKGGLRLTRLVAGVDYDVAVGRVGIAGNLPWQIAEYGKPWSLKPTVSGPLPEMVSKVFTVGFPVSEARVSPSIVAPGMPIRQQMALLSALYKDKPNEHRIANLLFTPPAQQSDFSENVQQYAFQVRPPTVPLEVWESHQATLANATPQRMAAVAIRTRMALNGDRTDAEALTDRADMLTQINERRQGSGSFAERTDEDVSKDVSVDDPRVTGYKIELGGDSTEYLFKDEPRPANEIHLVQRPPVTFDVKVDAAAKVTPDPANRKVTITVNAAQSLTELKITPLAPAAPKLPDPVLLLLEVARSFAGLSLEQLSKKLHECLTAGPWTEGNPGEIPLELAWSTVTEIGDIASLIERFDIQVQRYIWDGRPLEYLDTDKWIDGFRFKKASDPTYDEELTRLDGMYFGGRDSSDRRDEPRALVEFDVANGAKLTPWPLQNDRGAAAYYRFAVRAINRYAPILVSNATVDSRITPLLEKEERWKRAVVPCRLAGKRNPPAVKLILPLTSAQPKREGSDKRFAPDLLVVLEENALDHPGIAGGMRARLAQAAVPKDLIGGADPDSLYEVGADPMQHAPGDAIPLAGKANDLGVTLRGPIGYTFDSGGVGSRFIRTAYVVPVEDTLKSAGVPIDTRPDLSWWFLKLSLRHTVHPRSLVTPKADDATETDLDSDWTVPVWTQVLPAGNRWLLTNADKKQALYDTAEIALALGKDGGLRDKEGGVLDPTRLKLKNQLLFQTWILIMEPIEDLLGRPGQERFKDLVPFSAIGKVSPTDRVRLVGIQFRAPADVPLTFDGLSQRLFPAPASHLELSDAQARIVQVSPPIDLRR